jgi:hypothetical protein
MIRRRNKMIISLICKDCKNCYDTNLADDEFQKCPYCGSLNKEEELEKERIFLDLQKEIREGIEAYERGECISLEEARKELGLN